MEVTVSGGETLKKVNVDGGVWWRRGEGKFLERGEQNFREKVKRF